MKRLKLKKIEHEYKISDKADDIEPNVTESCLFEDEDGSICGFFLTKMTEKACKIADVANAEFLSKRVPKTALFRTDEFKGRYEKELAHQNALAKKEKKYSTILGSVKAQPNMRRMEPRISSVHTVESAQTFIKAMLKLCKECENIYKKHCPDAYLNHVKAVETVADKWKFGSIFTSSISNYNISVPVHIDRANITETCNIIVSKKYGTNGGNLYIPDYDLCFDQCDNSILVFPVWRNIHCVTPIHKTHEDGYRNSLVFYPQKCFLNTK